MAYVPPKSTTGDATTALREDIVRSLVARVVLLCDLFYDEEAAQSGPESIPLSGLPVRLAAPWLADVLVSDYVTADDDLESYTDTVQRFSDIGAPQRSHPSSPAPPPVRPRSSLSPASSWCSVQMSLPPNGVRGDARNVLTLHTAAALCAHRRSRVGRHQMHPNLYRAGAVCRHIQAGSS